MPWYELFCLAKPRLTRVARAELLRAAATPVLQAGGVLTDLKNFGDQPLAYEVRVPGQKFAEALMWQISFVGPPTVLSDLRYNMKIDERILRHVFLRTSPHKPSPSTFAVKKRATQLLLKAQAAENRT